MLRKSLKFINRSWKLESKIQAIVARTCGSQSVVPQTLLGCFYTWWKFAFKLIGVCSEVGTCCRPIWVPQLISLRQPNIVFQERRM